jgi:Domain of unknown function (DUF4091)/Putative Ig domain
MTCKPSIRVCRTDNAGRAGRGRSALSLACVAAWHIVLWSACFATQKLDAADPLVWAASSLTRIGQSSPAGGSSEIDLSAAKDETYSFQIGVQAPPGGLTNVNVTTSGLTGLDSRVIAGTDVALFREQYIYVPSSPPYYWNGKSDGTNPPGPPGWYPDGLIPFVDLETGQPAQGGVLNAVPFNVEAGTNQTIWVDLHVPVDAPAGPYTGVFTITSDQGQSSVQVTLHVWNFTLPKAPSFKSSYQADPSHQDSYMTHELLRNRVSPAWDKTSDERTLIDQWGLTATNAWFSSGIYIGNCNTRLMPPAPSVAQFQAVKARHQPDILLLNFSADEISRCPQQYSTLKEWARNMHAAGIENMVTVMPTPALEDDGTGSGRSAVDIWVELPAQYDQAIQEIKKVLAKGDSVWSYNVLVQDGYSPKHEITFTPLDYRLNMGFISQSLGITGFQQWKVDQWTSDPWNSLPQYQGVYGDGLLVYPGKQVGVIGYAPSTRLKWSRDGVNDFEYVQMLKTLGEGDWALQQAQSVGPDWRNWTRDYAQVEAVRLALGNRIDQLLGGQSSNAPVVNSPSSAQSTVGTAFTYQITGTNNPTSFDAVGLPPGLTINQSSGRISGTLSVAGKTRIVIAASNAAGTGSATLDINVTALPSSIALAQFNAVEGSAVGSISAAFPASNTAGNLIIAFVRMSTSTQTVSITDTAGNTYSDAIAQAQDADGHQVHVFYAKNIGGGANSVTATFSSTNNHPWLAIYEYSGLSASNPLDQIAAAQGGGSTASTGPAATTTSANELVFVGAGFPADFSGTVTIDSGYPSTQQDTGTSRAANKAAIVSSTGSYTGTFILNASTNWTAVLATFKP